MTIIDGKALFSGGKNHLDIYLNFVCNLRCNHCFMGTELDRKESFAIASVISLLQYARQGGCHEVSFLGGEPTLYRELPQLVDLAFELGYTDVKIITNGLHSFGNFLKRYELKAQKPVIVFSVDGRTKNTFEKIRGKNTFETCWNHMLLAASAGFPCAGIISVSNDNINEVAAIVQELSDRKFLYINIHHVNSLGFAHADSIVSVEDWISLRSKLMALAPAFAVKIKFERKFVSYAEPDSATHCVIEQESGGNIMVFPDGRVYKCALFFNAEGLNSLIWDGTQIMTNFRWNEKLICGQIGSCEGCAGTSYLKLDIDHNLNPEHYKMICMYKKEIL